MAEKHLEGRTVIVTGAGRGIGRAIAVALADAGADVAVNDTTAAALEPVTGELRERGTRVCAVAADVADPGAVRDMVADVEARLGPVSVLVNNAGFLRPTAFSQIPVAEWNAVIAVNLTGTFLCSQAVLPAMQAARWGRIVNMSSTRRQERQHRRRCALHRSQGRRARPHTPSSK